MIDVQVFQKLLLVVCILAFLAGVLIFSSVETWSGNWKRRAFARLFAASTVIASGIAGLVLVMLK